MNSEVKADKQQLTVRGHGTNPLQLYTAHKLFPRCRIEEFYELHDEVKK